MPKKITVLFLILMFFYTAIVFTKGNVKPELSPLEKKAIDFGHRLPSKASAKLIASLPKPSEDYVEDETFDYVLRNYNMDKSDLVFLKAAGINLGEATHAELLDMEKWVNRYERNLEKNISKAVVLKLSDYKYCKAQVDACGLCFSKGGNFKNRNQYCLYEKNSIEKSFIETTYGENLDQKIQTLMDEDGIKDRENPNLIAAETYTAIDEFSKNVANKQEYDSNFKQYQQNHPVMCFAKTSDCLSTPEPIDKLSEEVLAHFGVDPQVLLYIEDPKN